MLGQTKDSRTKLFLVVICVDFEDNLQFYQLPGIVLLRLYQFAQVYSVDLLSILNYRYLAGCFGLISGRHCLANLSEKHRMFIAGQMTVEQYTDILDNIVYMQEQEWQ